MQVTRQHVVDILRLAALPELAEEAYRVLPDPADALRVGGVRPVQVDRVREVAGDGGFQARQLVVHGRAVLREHFLPQFFEHGQNYWENIVAVAHFLTTSFTQEEPRWLWGPTPQQRLTLL